MKTRTRKLLIRGYFFVTGLGLSLVFSGSWLVFKAQAATPLIPTTTLNGAQVPDWSRITFDSLPEITSNGNFQADSNIINQLGYNPSRQWSAGQEPEGVLSLGDFQDSFQLQNLNLDTIAAASGIDTRTQSLDSFGVMVHQSLESLMQAVPSLGDFPIDQVPAVRDLIAQSVGSFDSSQTISQLLNQSPQLGELSFANLDLSQYTINSIPNLGASPLGTFEDWQQVTIEAIPGLANVPFSDFPGAPTADGQTIGKVDVVFGAAENSRSKSISGSKEQGFGVPCEKGCGHIELSGGAVLGRQWVSGKYQDVSGGHGILEKVNGGKEPTGRHPFGDAFKLVITDISEPQATATLAMFFRFCGRNGPVDLGCTPYFIGPMPFMTVKENDPIFLGQVTNEASSAPSTPTALALSEMQDAQEKLNGHTSTSASREAPSSAQQNTAAGVGSSFTSPRDRGTYAGVNLDALSSSLSTVESSGNYGAVGSYVCDASDNCGRALGSFQFMSYRSDVRATIEAQPGGTSFLQSLDSGATPSNEQILQYFPPEAQRRLFEDDIRRLIDIAMSQIDPTTGQPFTGSRLIERVAQMHFGGEGVPINSGATDAKGQTVATYGASVQGIYAEIAKKS
ncbi:MAG: hypothetical protein ICV55_06800 [Coleofasciculus sp. C3-bin4]|nr:hypothetical protein [Coleofasciculus sp. C3-bin4]